jgi:hypothetical protein
MFLIRVTIPPVPMSGQVEQNATLGTPTVIDPAAGSAEGLGANSTTYIALFFVTIYLITAALASWHAYDREGTVDTRRLDRHRAEGHRRLQAARSELSELKAQRDEANTLRKANQRAEKLGREAVEAVGVVQESEQLVAHARAIGDPDGVELLIDQQERRAQRARGGNVRSPEPTP